MFDTHYQYTLCSRLKLENTSFKATPFLVTAIAQGNTISLCRKIVDNITSITGLNSSMVCDQVALPTCQ